MDQKRDRATTATVTKPIAYLRNSDGDIEPGSEVDLSKFGKPLADKYPKVSFTLDIPRELQTVYTVRIERGEDKQTFGLDLSRADFSDPQWRKLFEKAIGYGFSRALNDGTNGTDGSMDKVLQKFGRIIHGASGGGSRGKSKLQIAIGQELAVAFGKQYRSMKAAEKTTTIEAVERATAKDQDLTLFNLLTDARDRLTRVEENKPTSALAALVATAGTQIKATDND